MERTTLYLYRGVIILRRSRRPARPLIASCPTVHRLPSISHQAGNRTLVDAYVRAVGANTWEPYQIDVEFVLQFAARRDRKRAVLSPQPELETDERTNDQ